MCNEEKEDELDYQLGIEVLQNPGRVYSSEEVRKLCGLESD